MAEIVLKHVQKVYPNNESKKKGFFGKKKTVEKKHNLKVTEDGVLAVEDFNLTVHDQEFIVLVGWGRARRGHSRRGSTGSK